MMSPPRKGADSTAPTNSEESSPIMSIANELSSDVATAVLSSDKQDAGRRDSRALAEVVMEVHSTLRRLSSAQRKGARRLAAADSTTARDAAKRG